MSWMIRRLALVILTLTLLQLASVRNARADAGWKEVVCTIIAAGGAAMCCSYFPIACPQCVGGGVAIYQICMEELGESDDCEEWQEEFPEEDLDCPAN